MDQIGTDWNACVNFDTPVGGGPFKNKISEEMPKFTDIAYKTSGRS